MWRLATVSLTVLFSTVVFTALLPNAQARVKNHTKSHQTNISPTPTPTRTNSPKPKPRQH
jgi:hypothetical protein